ncbi:Endoribonuclease L-PSP [Gymnopilus junonius]|uniref:Endoribonuclease L-PSP n=1 Tax=Gymnopilus junonius TaxID=109634 RepID=A0A9P5NBD1_GYMJU|nr:Endoribonuclease L-PSP [Gymnopilus junonius]
MQTSHNLTSFHKTKTMKTIYTPDALPVLPVFSQAAISSDFVYMSGNIGCTKEFKLVPGVVQAQTHAALENIRTILKAAGSDLKHIIKANIYMMDMEKEFGLMNEVYMQAYACRMCVGVKYLPFSTAIEIKCVAEILK